MENLTGVTFVHKTLYRNTPGGLLKESFLTEVWEMISPEGFLLATINDRDVYKILEKALKAYNGAS